MWWARTWSFWQVHHYSFYTQDFPAHFILNSIETSLLSGKSYIISFLQKNSTTNIYSNFCSNGLAVEN